MTIKTYDIFELAKDLKKAGVNDDVIEAQVKFEKSKDEAMLNTLATKHDIALILKDLIWFKVIGSVLGTIILSALTVLLNR